MTEKELRTIFPELKKEQIEKMLKTISQQPWLIDTFNKIYKAQK